MEQGHSVTWNLVFEAGEHWICRFLEPGFGHVWAYRSIGDEAWLYINPASSYWQTGIFLMHEVPDMREITGEACRIVKVTSQISDPWGVRVPWLFGTVTCVEAIKGLLGIGSPWIITPYQLWRWAHETAETQAVCGGEEPAASSGR